MFMEGGGEKEYGPPTVMIESSMALQWETCKLPVFDTVAIREPRNRIDVVSNPCLNVVAIGCIEERKEEEPVKVPDPVKDKDFLDQALLKFLERRVIFPLVKEWCDLFKDSQENNIQCQAKNDALD